MRFVPRHSVVCERGREWISLRLDGELSELAQKMLDSHLARCPECRVLRREGRGVTRARTMHEVTCAICGAMTQVPFLPTQGRPVYCQDCFQQIRTRN